jgi:hypothetical protein
MRASALKGSCSSARSAPRRKGATGSGALHCSHSQSLLAAQMPYENALLWPQGGHVLQPRVAPQALPWVRAPRIRPTPTGLWLDRPPPVDPISARRRNPVGVDWRDRSPFPRVAAARQPWAGGQHAVGVSRFRFGIPLRYWAGLTAPCLSRTMAALCHCASTRD